jgi:hypothetical protein
MKKQKVYFVHYLMMTFILLSFRTVVAFNSDSTIVDSNKTKYNGIDIYSGRLINGIGFGFNQYVEEQIDGRQEIESISDLYFYMKKNISVSISNQTSIRKITPTDEISFSSDPVNSTTRISAQLRPFPGLQLFPNVKVGNSKLIYNSRIVGFLSVRQNTSIINYGLSGIFISSDGLVCAKEADLKWMFYLDENIPFISPQQTLISFKFNCYDSDYNGISEKLDRALKEDDDNYITKRSFETDWREYSFSSQINYGISKILRSGIGLKYKSFSSKLWDDYLNLDNRANQSNGEILIEPRLSVILSRKFYQQINIQYRQFYENSAYLASFNEKLNRDKSYCDFNYQFHWLSNVNNPSLKKVLANNNGVFGNRLTKGSLHLQLNVNRLSNFIHNRYYKIFESSLLLDLFHPNLESQIEQIQLNAFYGLTNYVQIGFSNSVEIKKSFKPLPGSTDSKWLKKETLINSVSIDWANYKFSNRWQEIYGWYNLSTMDQYDKPILQPKMVKGKFECSFHSLSRADEFYGDVNIFNSINNNYDFPFYNNKIADLNSNFTIGLWGNVELQCAGQHFYYSSKERNYLDKDWQLDFYLRWQPFKKFRLELLQNSSRFVNNWDSRFSYYLDPFIYDVDVEFYNKTIHTWNIRIISLF